MAATAGARPSDGGRPGHAAARSGAARELTPAEIAWLAALPVAALTLLLVVALGPFVGDTLLPKSSVRFWQSTGVFLHPEPQEQGRFLVGLSGPLLLAGAVGLLARRPPRLPAPLLGRLTWTAQALAVACAIAFFVVQRGLVFGTDYEAPEPFHQRYFTNATLLASLLGAVGIAAAARSPRVRGRFAAWTRETPARRLGATFAAALLTAVWLLHAFNTEGTVVTEAFAAAYHLQFTMDETFAVLNGRSPLVDFAAQYGSLWPYPVAAVMSVIGTSVGAFSAIMCIVSGIAMLAMFGVLRRVTRSALTALVLFAPFVATSFFLLRGPLENRYTFATIFADYPLRFAGPWFLAWLTARHLDGERPHRGWPLFLVAGLAATNNADHGVPALAAVAAAVVWAGGRPTLARLRTLALEAGAGLLAAVALVCALTLARAGELPDPGLWLRFARLFAVAGYAMLPMPAIGLHTIVYMTLAAALAVATVRALGATGQDAPGERVMTGMLAFCAIFGLASGSYYAGRSHPEVLIASFAIWSFTLALLTVLAIRRLAAQSSRWPEPAAAACLVAFCVMACSLAQTPTPWSQLDRLRATAEPVLREPAGQQFVAAHVRPGEHVVILMLLGHRIAENVDVDNVSLYTGAASMPTVEQLDDTVRALRASGGRKVFLSADERPTELGAALQGGGFERTARDGDGYELWVDRAGAR